MSLPSVALGNSLTPLSLHFLIFKVGTTILTSPCRSQRML